MRGREFLFGGSPRALGVAGAPMAEPTAGQRIMGALTGRELFHAPEQRGKVRY